MKKTAIVLFLIASLLSIGACGQRRSTYRVQHTIPIKKVRVYHLEDGRWGYHDDTMNWYYLYLLQNNSYYSGPSIRSTGGISGAAWRAATPDNRPSPTDLEKIQEQEQNPEQTEQLVEAEEIGIVESGTEISEIITDAQALEGDTVTIESMETGPDTNTDYGSTESPSSESSSSDSGSSDSGGGDGGGGGE